MDPGKLKALLDWVNSTGIQDVVGSLDQLSDGLLIIEIINCMQLNETSNKPTSTRAPWIIIKEFLESSNLGCIVQHIDWESVTLNGSHHEIAKVLLLLLSLTITCPNKDKLIIEMTYLEKESQVHIRHILSEALAERNLTSSGQSLYNVLSQKVLGDPPAAEYSSPTDESTICEVTRFASLRENLLSLASVRGKSHNILPQEGDPLAPPTDQPDGEYSDSPARNSSIAAGPSMTSVNESPTPIHNRSIQILGRCSYRTPVKQIFKSMEEEEVFFSVPASCPPLRRGYNPRHSFQDSPSFIMSAEGSPVQEFLSSPAVNYRIKIRDLEQKNVILEKNLHAERLAKEESEKVLLEKETALEQSERKIRDMSRCSVEKQQLFDEIDELHTIRSERDTLQKENSKLKLRLEKYDTYSHESKDLRRDLDAQLQENEEKSKQIKNLKTSLAKFTEENKQAVELEDSLKNLQEANALQEQEISHLLTQLHKLKAQNIEQKEHYESRISDYKSMIEDKESSGLENQGESMGVIFMEHRVGELQEIVKDMEENWIKPNIGAKLSADLDAAKEAMGQYQVKLQSVKNEKMVLEEEISQFQQEVMTKNAEITDSMKKLTSLTQKLKSSETIVETLRVQVQTLSGDKESLKSRIKDLETETCDSNGTIAKLQLELNLSKSENESDKIAIQNHMRRFSDSSQKIADFEHQCRTVESELSEKSAELEDLKKSHKTQIESIEKMMANDQRCISKLEEQIKILEKDRESSNSEMQQLSESLLHEKQSLSESKQERDSLKMEVKRYHSACSELEKTCNILRSKLKDSRESSEENLKLKEEEITKLKEEDAATKISILTLEEDLEKMKKDAASKSEDLRILCEKLKAVGDARDSLVAKKNNLEEELQEKTKKFSKMEDDTKNSLASCVSLTAELENARMELDRFRENHENTLNQKDEKISNLEKEISLKQEGVASIEKEIESFRMTLSQKSVLQQEMESRMECMEEDHQTQMEDVAKSILVKDEKILMLEGETSRMLENHVTEISSLQSSLEVRDSQHQELDELIRNLEHENGKLQEDEAASQEEVKKMNDTLQEERSLLKKREDDICRLEDEILKRGDEYENAILKKQAEIESLLNRVQSLKDESHLMEEDKESLTKEVEELSGKNDELRTSLRESSESLEIKQRESMEIRAHLEQKLIMMGEVKKELEEVKISEKQHLENLTKLQLTIEEETENSSKLRESGVRKKEELDAGKLRITSLEEEKRIFEEKINILEQQIEVDAEAREETVAHLIRVKSEVESSEKNHKEDLENLSANILMLQENLKKTKEEREMLEEECRKIEEKHSASYATVLSRLEESDKTKEKLEKESQNLKTMLDDAENRFMSSQSDLEQLSNQHEQLTEERKSRVGEIENLTKNLESLTKDSQGENDVLRACNLEVKTMLEDAENRFTSSQSQLEKLADEHDKLTEEHKSCLEEIKNLKEDLESLQKDSQDENDVLKSSNSELETKMESLKKESAQKDSDLEEAFQIKTSLQEEIESLNHFLEDQKQKNESLTKKFEDEMSALKSEKEERILREDHHLNLEEKLKMKDAEVEEASRKIESIAEMLNCQKQEYDEKMQSLEIQITEANQTVEYLEIDKKSLQITIDENDQAHTDKLCQAQTARDQALKSFENEKDRYHILESRLKKEVLGVENELAEAKNLARVITDEKEFYEGKCLDLEAEQKESEVKITQLESDVTKVQKENSDLQTEINILSEQNTNLEEKVKAIRAQFAEKYREKQEKVAKLEKELTNWQTRADEETSRYDNMAAMYNEKRAQLNDTVNNLDQTREENLDLQEVIRNLKMKNEKLTTSSSQLNVKKIEEEKKIRALSAEVHRLTAQLQFAERQLREQRTGAKSFRHSSLGSQPLMPVEEILTPRRRSLEISDDAFSSDNLFRCRSDTCLDSPLTANKKKRKDQEECLDDSLDDILRTPVNLQTRNIAKSESDIQGTDQRENGLRAMNRSHISIESSLLSESPNHLNQRQSHLQLNSSQISHDSTDLNMNSSNLAEASFAASSEQTGNRGRHSSMPRHPSSLAFQTEEEPEDYEWGSLSRLAELQRRNAATLPHLKSSYPIETQGKTPSKCDETVRIGDADGTLRRMTQTSATLQRSLASSFHDTRSKRMTIDVHNDRNFESLKQHQAKRKIGAKEEEGLPNKNRRETISSSGSYESASEQQWGGSIPINSREEDKEQVDPKRMSMMFEIPNSPRKPQLRSRTARKTPAEKSRSDSASTSKRISSLIKTPDKSKTAKKIVEEKRRTPSLMDRVKRPLGRFNLKK